MSTLCGVSVQHALWQSRYVKSGWNSGNQVYKSPQLALYIHKAPIDRISPDIKVTAASDRLKVLQLLTAYAADGGFK